MLFLRSLLFSAGFLLVLITFGILTVFIIPLSYGGRYAVLRRLARFVMWWLEKTCRITYEVEGRENIPSGVAIIMSKHQSAWETFALQEIFPPQVWVLKRELLWVPFMGWGLSLLDPIAIDRKRIRKSMRQIVEQGCQRLETGRWVVVFPEGTRVAQGDKKRYGLGGALLARSGAWPVVPVTHNAGEFWPKRGFLKRPGIIRVHIGPVIDTKGKTAKEINLLAEKWIEGGGFGPH
ncbi:MAG: 1-acyl-sn-glycerol-3-phosphate acyltransferase [Gammaproteobacteria bacterium]|nr:1-acyl-sn-glycerol-3-phosphate acyltransferase [Gammaproteobacteria bacterium]